MSMDDECSVAAPEEERQACGFNAIQLRGQKMQAEEGEKAQCGGLSLPQNANCKSTVEWAARGGKKDAQASEWFKDMKAVSGLDFQNASHPFPAIVFLCCARRQELRFAALFLLNAALRPVPLKPAAGRRLSDVPRQPRIHRVQASGEAVGLQGHGLAHHQGDWQ